MTKFTATRWCGATAPITLVHPVQFLRDEADPYVRRLNSTERMQPGSAIAYLAPTIFQSAAEADGSEYIVVVRNEHCVLSEALLDRYAAALVDLERRVGANWLLATPSGLGLDGTRHVSSYYAMSPALPRERSLSLTCDTLPDIYAINPRVLSMVRDYVAPYAFDGFELAAIYAGICLGAPSFHLSELACPINGSPYLRDFSRISSELTWLTPLVSGDSSVATLSGKIAVERPVAEAVHSQALRLPTLSERIDEIRKSYFDPFGVSIVVRTNFQRRPLLRRLLASVVRAKVPGVEMEVILSTDTDEAAARAAFDSLLAEYPHDLRLVHNKPDDLHSRVRNLVGGIRAASGDYIWIIDDDDYISASAFEEMRPYLAFGQRPFLFASSTVVREAWKFEGVRGVLERSDMDHVYKASNWTSLFLGVNQIPICGFVCPRDHMIATLDKIELKRNLSEDYALLLALLASAQLPPVREIDASLSYISIREGGDNTVTAVDRRPWTEDIQSFLSDILSDGRLANTGFWDLIVNSTRAESKTRDRRIAEGERTFELLVQRNRDLAKTLRLLEQRLDDSRRRLAAIAAQSDEIDSPGIGRRRRNETGEGLDSDAGAPRRGAKKAARRDMRPENM